MVQRYSLLLLFISAFAQAEVKNQFPRSHQQDAKIYELEDCKVYNKNNPYMKNLSDQELEDGCLQALSKNYHVIDSDFSEYLKECKYSTYVDLAVSKESAERIRKHLQDIESTVKTLKKELSLPEELEVDYLGYKNSLRGFIAYQSSLRKVVVSEGAIVFKASNSIIMFALLHEAAHVRQHINSEDFIKSGYSETAHYYGENQADTFAASMIQCPICLAKSAQYTRITEENFYDKNYLARQGYLSSDQLIN